MSFPIFLGATKGDTFTGAGQSNGRDLCHHSVFPTSKQLPSNDAGTIPQADPSGQATAELYFHAWWYAQGA